MSSLDDAMSKLSNLDESEGSGITKQKFDDATKGLQVNVIDNLNLLKQEKNDFVKYAITNTLVQYGNFIDVKGMKPNKITKSIGELGITVMYALQEYPVGIHIYLSQDGKSIAYKYIELAASRETCTGKSEVTAYDAAGLVAGGAVLVGASKVLGDAATVAAPGVQAAVKAGVGVAKVASDSTVQAANAVAKATEAGMSKKIAEKAGERVGAQVAKRVETSTAQQLLLHDAKAGAAVAKKVGTEAAKKTTTAVGSVVTSGATKAVTAGAQVATKMGAKGAEEAAKKIGETLAKESVQMGVGAGAVVVAALAGGIALYNVCNNYVPKVYHYCVDDTADNANGTWFIGYSLVKMDDDFVKLGVNKKAASVFVKTSDYVEQPANPILVFPTVPNKDRKGLYGLFHTTSTAWPHSSERKSKVIERYKGLQSTVMA